ncbi:MAG: CinA family nicotinamide mononucleotide deamidase-related protein [Myxococcales bacterium FL481]|nr:MAG: CinA family nicotinamide mononucleotide deamidase-related protein [Myxococcales bacterium FL481]
MAAHPVRDQKQLFILDEREVVLVVGPFHAHIGLGCVANAHEQSHAVSGDLPELIAHRSAFRPLDICTVSALCPDTVGASTHAHRAAVITIGDEVLAGDVVDTNRAYLGQRCRALGLAVIEGRSVRDRTAEIAAALREIGSRVDVCLVSGGLGPTTDDLTTIAVAELLGRTLVRDETVVEELRRRFAARGRELVPTNLKQADFPEGSEVLANPIGTAPGFWCDAADLGRAEGGPGPVVICMPGVPSELRRMMTEQVEPRLAQRYALQPVARRTYRLLAIGESTVQHVVDGLLRRDDSALPWSRVFVHYRARSPEIFLELEATDPELSARDLAAFDAPLCEAFAGKMYGIGSASLAARVVEALRAAQLSVAVAESCTGGLLGSYLTEVPGVSDVFVGGVISYANRVKERSLGVSAELLAEHGAVSEPVAIAMAQGVRERVGADVGVGITGIAGPDGGTVDKPVGTVFVAVAHGDRSRCLRLREPGSRAGVRHRSAMRALALLWEQLAERGSVDIADLDTDAPDPALFATHRR